jgi:hypothetical protein
MIPKKQKISTITTNNTCTIREAAFLETNNQNSYLRHGIIQRRRRIEGLEKNPSSVDRLFVSSSSFLLFFFFFVSLEIAKRLQNRNPTTKQTNKQTEHHSMMLSKTKHKLMENSF